MGSNKWLIRTKSQHILGPITKDKIIELIENNSLGEEDEICSGNGYWFHLKEKDLLDLYLYKGERQGFNEVSEALNEFRKREKEARKSALNQDDQDKVDTQVIKLNEFGEPVSALKIEKKSLF